MTHTGTVIEERKNYWIVDTPEGELRATLKGTARKTRMRVCVGDRVDVRDVDAAAGEAVIERIHSRRTFLPRPPVANIDQVVFVNTIHEPDLDLETVDRFLFSAELFELSTVIVVNKVDLLDDTDRPALDNLRRLYESLGHAVMETSADSGTGMAELVAACRGKVSCFAGVSGVGKTSLLARIFPGREFRTQELSGKIGRGVHTTTHTSLLPLDGGGYLVDTPGFSFVELPEIATPEAIACFPEINETGTQCRFGNCLHGEEPGCAVREAVEAGRIAPSRYDNYTKFIGIIREREREHRGSTRKAGR